jgi:hypothetical protein
MRLIFHCLVGLISFTIGVGCYFALVKEPVKPTEFPAGAASVNDTDSKASEPLPLTTPTEEPLTAKMQIQKWLRREELDEDWHDYWTEYPDGDGPSYPESGRLQLEDLNGDGKRELFIFQGCIVSGNCSLDIYLSKQGGPVKILSTGQTESVKKLKSSVRGFDDLELRTWNGAFEFYVRILKFNGKKYREDKCWFETNMIKGKMLKKPVVTHIDCGDYGYVE